MDLTQTRLKEMLRYDPETGHFWWLKRGGRRAKIKFDEPAGYKDSRGYVLIGLDGRHHYAHRLAWLYMTGEFPDNEIDHENVDPSDNHWKNLRKARHHQNLSNIRAHKDNRSGYKGVFEHKPGVWRSRIMVRGVVHDLGLFGCPRNAHAAYVKAANDLHGEFARAA